MKSSIWLVNNRLYYLYGLHDPYCVDYGKRIFYALIHLYLTNIFSDMPEAFTGLGCTYFLHTYEAYKTLRQWKYPTLML